MEEAAAAYLAFARKLIEEKRYEDARVVLKMVEHPIARKWLAQLDRIAPETKSIAIRQLEQSWVEVAPKMSFKVLSQKDQWFTSKFDPETLELAINGYAEQGWRVRTGATATIPGLMGKREEMILVLERPTDPRSEMIMFEYKILSQKDKWFTGKFDPDTIEQAINSYAEQGWRVVHAVTATIPGFGGNREEMIIILERSKKR